MKQTRYNIRVSKDLKGKFDSKCKENMQVPSMIIRELMKLYLNEGNQLFNKKGR